MRARKEKSELHISFSQQNNKRQADDNMLHQQMLRVHATQKLTMMNELWKMHQSQLCKFFTTYPLFPHAIFTIKDLLNSRFLKLIKSDGKIYFGEIQMKKRNGYGICVYKEGKLFEGTFCNNDRHGKGVEIYANGNLYIGEFLNNKKHGRGQFYWFNMKEDGRKNQHEMEYFDGDWWGGLPDGEGLHQKNNGDIYEGTFKNGLKHGMGEEMFGNGDYYKGEYVNGLPEGFGEYVWADKSRYKGDFKQGLRNGYGYWESQKKQETYQGHYCMDKKSGYGVYEWGNGLCYKGSFEQDYRNGYGELFDRNEMIYQGYWEQGEKTTGQDIQPSKQQKKIKTPKSLEQNNRTSLISSRKPTLNIEDRITKYKPSRTILPGKNDFSIRKRPQSFSNIRKQEAVIYHSTPKKSMEIKTNKETTTISGSRTSTKMPFSTLYVPWDS